MSCLSCIDTLNEINEIPKCEACGKIDILESNYWVQTVIDLYNTVFIKDGCIDINSIKAVLDLEEVCNDDRKEATLKIMTYLNTYLSSIKSNKLNKIK